MNYNGSISIATCNDTEYTSSHTAKILLSPDDSQRQFLSVVNRLRWKATVLSALRSVSENGSAKEIEQRALSWGLQ